MVVKRNLRGQDYNNDPDNNMPMALMTTLPSMV
jgi:hypothetical protein